MAPASSSVVYQVAQSRRARYDSANICVEGGYWGRTAPCLKGGGGGLGASAAIGTQHCTWPTIITVRQLTDWWPRRAGQARADGCAGGCGLQASLLCAIGFDERGLLAREGKEGCAISGQLGEVSSACVIRQEGDGSQPSLRTGRADKHVQNLAGIGVATPKWRHRTQAAQGRAFLFKRACIQSPRKGARRI